MAFESFSAFLTMEGHGAYVWGCYGVFFVLLAGLMIRSTRHYRAVLNGCKRRYQEQNNQAMGARPNQAATFARVEVSQD
ncbi:heme exporter protein CcmD [Marinobacter sp. VGCF2001]|uniref:heme exporter protein CcmD n=1 Tax=Marinobacter sp. VGCF2001 TaxID=3417189 RepID=UPI003CE8BB81